MSGVPETAADPRPSPPPERPDPLPMVVGPTRPHPSVLRRMARAADPIDAPSSVRDLRRALVLTRRLLGAPAALPFALPGTGTAGMESLAASLLAPGAPVLVASTGMWGDRWRDICLRLGVPAHAHTCAPGRAPDPGEVGRRLAAEPHQALLLTHVDSSSGVRTPVAELAGVARAHGALVLVDGISAAGAEDVRQEVWGVDAYLTSTPKALGIPAGLYLAALGPRAADALRARTWAPRHYSLDLRGWAPVMRAALEGRFAYHQSLPGNLIGALAEGLELVVEEGRERVRRHRRLALRLRSALDAEGLANLVADDRDRANGVSVYRTPPGLTTGELLRGAAGHGVLLQAGTHPRAAEETFRVGHLGNVDEHDIDRTADALRRLLAPRE
ncbi:aminotransferase class V-fold PLP-dependent enzyme [Streptomonospora sp. S1-112]|uniref:Aminotransferase class V-fold PLP-dependent enzyme n=1 Tax=Streptomonospora mangrovi TaxID=2883123 RepID=A0A9X3SCZ8_9ACTN|nr:aminotransferase class V-fold PLP-dependent enzyme [Streptomonospora mangrovi]MDA0564238.1 aminotransferase class V-fold PLP-dependent enzyme [Streptomonospora mangrovi]